VNEVTLLECALNYKRQNNKDLRYSRVRNFAVAIEVSIEGLLSSLQDHVAVCAGINVARHSSRNTR
jgi:hypothetical protein